MIKVGIIGGENPIAGELIRLLVLHPEVELMGVCAPELRGRAIASHHRGIIGETDMRFSDSLDLSTLDIAFVTSATSKISGQLPPELKVVVIQEDDNFRIFPPFDTLEYVPGVSEMFRKPLVRDASAARILPSPTSVAIIILFPLALHLLLNESLTIKVSLPKYRKNLIDTKKMKEEIETQLRKAQRSFKHLKEIEIERSKLLRAVAVDVEFDCSVTEDEIERIYSQTYDDHNFTFIMRTDPAATEVAGTQKCLLHINKPTEGRVRIRAVADSFMRGGAGDAIHAMNLLFGLYEKTGLSFPASMAFKHDEIMPEEA